MARALSLIGMAGGFLAISPKIRECLVDGYNQAGIGMDAHSPYSYIALSVAVVGALLVFLNKASQPR
ncbi:MAG: hypothetical protein LAQ69_37745 [Acidobacteriia bacterium]|nr:hypothetical protein [Terriglobia bacterium]